jgi:hypothetical protein
LEENAVISWYEFLSPVFNVRKMSGGAEPPTELSACLRQLVGRSSFKGQQHKAAGETASHLGQQESLSGGRSFRQKIAQFTSNRDLRRRHPHASGQEQHRKQSYRMRTVHPVAP